MRNKIGGFDMSLGFLIFLIAAIAVAVFLLIFYSNIGDALKEGGLHTTSLMRVR